MTNRTLAGGDARAARRHLERAIAHLDQLSLHQAAAHADLALVSLNDHCRADRRIVRTDWPSLQ